MQRTPDSVELDERAFFAPAPAVDLPSKRPTLTPPAIGPETETSTEGRPRRSTLPPLPNWRFALRSAGRAAVLEWERGILFLLLPPAMMLGVLAYLALPIEPSLVALGAPALVTAFAVWLARNRYPLQIALIAVLVFLIGGLSAGIETWRAGTKMLGAEISTRLTGRVVDIDHLANGRVRLTLDVLATERPKLRYAPDRVRVSAATVPASLASGSIIEGVARLFPPSGPLRPGSYDFAFESYFDRIGANGFFFRPPTIVTGEGAASWRQQLTASIDNFRNRVAGHIRSAIGGPEGEIAAALIVGVRAGIPEDVNEHLRRTGLAHILSISGLHMALVAASIMGSMRLAFAAFPAFASRHAVKKAAALIALIAVAAYLLISGAEVAAVRSFLMLAVMLAAVMFDRAALTMRNLAIAAILVLLIAPHEVVGPSFQMSFAATAALIGGYAAWTNWRSGRREQSPHRGALRLVAEKSRTIVIGIALTAIIAGLATSIYGAWHFQRVSPLSLFANLAVTPLTVGIMWTSVIAAIAMPFGLDGPFLGLIGLLLSWMLGIAKWLSEQSPVDAIGMIPVWSVILLTIALLVATLTTTWLRLLALPILIAGLVLLANRSLPDVFVSEDGRLVGVRTPDGNLAVNRARPNAFTVEDWQRALAAPEIVRPTATPEDETTQFACADNACTLVLPGGELIAHVEKPEQARAFCETAALIVVESPLNVRSCGRQGARIVNGRELARRGAATGYFENSAQQAEINMEFSITSGNRPWHDHRRFSRAARGMEPYRLAGAATSGEDR